MRLIDADELIRTLRELEWITDNPCDGDNVLEDIIDNAPTVEQECYITGAQWNEFMKEHRRPQGEWINQSQGAKYPCECSECHTEPFCNDEGYVLSDFCPKCGADMRGGREC